MATQPDACPRCESLDSQVMPEPCGPHFARLICRDCGQFKCWVSKPSNRQGSPSPDVLALVRRRISPVRLKGTPDQIRWADCIRSAMIAQARDEQIRTLLCNISDSTWFIGNQSNPLDKLRWPAVHQMAR
jgi:hypothetical protein